MNPHASVRRKVPPSMWRLWTVTAGVLVALVLTKATVAVAYRHRRATLARANALPSQILPRLAAAIGPTIGSPWSTVRTTPGTPKPTLSNPVLVSNSSRVMEYGDLARDGWTVHFQLNPAGAVTNTAGGWSDDARIGTAATRAGTIWRIRRLVVPVSGLLAAAGLLLAAAVRRWRHLIAGCALAPVAVCCVSAHLSTYADRTVFDPTRETVHLVPILFVPAALASYLWPVRRPVDGSHCRHCEYDLTGNISGVCPECGMTTGLG